MGGGAGQGVLFGRRAVWLAAAMPLHCKEVAMLAINLQFRMPTVRKACSSKRLAFTSHTLTTEKMFHYG